MKKKQFCDVFTICALPLKYWSNWICTQQRLIYAFVTCHVRRMSERRTLLSRPRTRVYDCNYNIGEGYYKPMMDHLDRKYYGASATPASGFFENPRSLFGSTGAAASAFDEFRSLSPIRSRRSGSDSRLSLPDDEFEQEVTMTTIRTPVLRC